MLSVSLSSSCFLVVVFFLLRAFVSVTVTSVYHGPRCSLCVVKPLSVMLPDFSYFLFHFGNLCPVHLVFCFTFPVFFSSLDALVFPVTWCVFIVSVSRLSFVMPSLDGCVFPYFTVPWDFYFFFNFLLLISHSLYFCLSESWALKLSFELMFCLKSCICVHILPGTHEFWHSD